MKSFLHVGCGPVTQSSLIGFNSPDWREIRFDIDPNVKPDILGTLTDMALVESGSVDALFSSHNIEHVYPHEVHLALREFHRVIKDDGMVVITCPDLQSVCAAVAQDRLLDPLYESPAGPISAIDILYGYRTSIARGNTYMAHKCGFTYSTLNNAFREAGFACSFGGSRPEHYDLWLMAFKTQRSNEEMMQIAKAYLPD